jgi:hypothetical protein
MQELFPFRTELEETLEAINSFAGKQITNTRHLLRLTLFQLLLGDLKSYSAELRAAASGLRDREPRELKHWLQLAVAHRLLFEDAECGYGFFHQDVTEAMGRVAGDWYNEAVVAETGLALAMLEGDLDNLRLWRSRRCRIPPVISTPRLSQETLYLARLFELDACSSSSSFLWQAGHAGVCAAIESGDFMAPVVAAICLCAERSGVTAGQALEGAADRLDHDLFPEGIDEDARLEVSDPKFCIKRNGVVPAIEIRIVVRGSGGRIRAIGPIVDGLVLAMPTHLLALIDRDLPVSEVRSARRRAEIDSVLEHTEGCVDAVVELQGDISMSDVDLSGYSARVGVAEEWVGALRTGFRAHCRLSVVHCGCK